MADEEVRKSEKVIVVFNNDVGKFLAKDMTYTATKVPDAYPFKSEQEFFLWRSKKEYYNDYLSWLEWK